MASSVLTAHRALIARNPALAEAHDPIRCVVCGSETAEATVTDTADTKPDLGAEIAAAVLAETEALAAEKASLESEVASLQGEIAALTAAKAAADVALVTAQNETAAAVARATAAEKVIADAAAAETAATERASRLTERVELAKAANPVMGDAYYAEQAEAWADMSPEAFAAFTGALSAAVKGMPHPYVQAAADEGEEAAAADKCKTCGAKKAEATHSAATSAATAETAASETASLTGETAAFKGGNVPTATAATSNKGRDYIDTVARVAGK